MGGLNLRYSYYEENVAFDTNCPECRKGLYQVKNPGRVDCEVCQGTGRDPIPWCELFKGTR